MIIGEVILKLINILIVCFFLDVFDNEFIFKILKEIIEGKIV